jgi:hypothetical protein
MMIESHFEFGEHGICEGNMMSNEACIGLEFGRWVRWSFWKLVSGYLFRVTIF